MKTVITICDRISGLAAFLAGLMMVLGLGLIVGEIIMRGFFNRTLYVAEEYAGYLMAMLTFCALGYTLRERGHIRMTFLHKVVKGRHRIWLDLVCHTIGLIFCLSLVWFTAIFFWDSVVSQTRSMQISQTYLAIPQFFLPLGASVLGLQFLGEMLRNIYMLRGDTEGLCMVEDLGNQGR